MVCSIEVEANERVFLHHLIIVYGNDGIPKSSLFDTNPARPVHVNWSST
jgi:hypothetical protein